ncbi:hypothetical protein MASR1M46_13810 [Bacteroidales bacterium]
MAKSLSGGAKGQMGSLYLFDERKLKNPVTSGDFHVEEVSAVDPVQRVIYFTANARRRRESLLYTSVQG